MMDCTDPSHYDSKVEVKNNPVYFVKTSSSDVICECTIL
jgi:hypothetical protein